jgi:SSS family solute:Na+ symporter
MHLHFLDWLIVVVSFLAFAGVAAWSGRQAKSVSGFLVSGRCAGRYLLTIAAGMVWIDAINIIAMFEAYYVGGFPVMGWGLMIQPPLAVIMAVSGWAVYRFRETKAMTVPQYLEMRYSRGVRITAGIVAWVAGMINFGIFPAVSAHFVMCFCGLPDHFGVAGVMLPTFPLLMAGMMAVTLLFVFHGGHITVLVMDFCQGFFINVAAVILVLVIGFTWLNWGQVVEILNQAPADASLLDPARTSNVKDFNIWYFVIGTIGMFYNRLSNFQGQAFDAAARTPHEGRMGNVLAQIRWHTLCLFFMVMVIAAMMALKHPAHASLGQSIQAWLDVLEKQHGAAVRGQMTVSTALAFILPVGGKGLLLAIMVAAMISSKSAFIHSFGSIFVQDVIMPFRKTHPEPQRQLRWLRLSMLGVTFFAVLFGCFYRQTESILMYFALSNTLWLGGSGAVLIGGLYWKKGNTTAAYAAMIVGAVFGLSGFAIMQGWEKWFGTPLQFSLAGHSVVINPQWWLLITMVVSTVTYVGVSLATRRGASFDLDRLLYRGKYRDDATPMIDDDPQVSLWKRICGITPEFTPRDRLTVYLLFGWIFAWFGACVVMIALSMSGKIGNADWAGFWKVYLIALFCLLMFTTVWLGMGGIRDLRTMFRLLKESGADVSDDGTVPAGAADATTEPVTPDKSADPA